jgi:hypothetical protein
MRHVLSRTVAILLVLIGVSAHGQQPAAQPQQSPKSNPTTATDTVASILERCWRADEIGSNRNVDFSQDVGLFRGQVSLRWCRTSIEARGPTERREKRDYLARIDSLTLHLKTDTIDAELRERFGAPPRLMVNGHAANPDWWVAGFRERILKLARVPLL